ncbi:MAG: hypothetical protein ABI186_01190 [Candidatus Elarobacter sp.]
MITIEPGTNLNGAVKTAPDAGMTYAEAARRIVERVNASRGSMIEYRNQGVVSKWTMHKKDDIRVVLESLSLTLRVGVAGPRQHIRDDGKPPHTEDIERVTRQILDYFAQPAPTHH